MIPGNNKTLRPASFFVAALIFSQPAWSDSAPESADSGMPVANESTLLVPAALQSSALLISSVTIDNGSVFDLDNPEEDKLLYRLANHLHIKTRDEVIAQQLLFEPGTRFDPQAIEESERILRANRYIQDASIHSSRNAAGGVDVDVETSDTWTLMPKLSLSRSGGKNSSSIGIREMNLLGSGASLEASFKSDVDRNYRTLQYKDRNLGNSWYGIAALFESNSDGYARGLQLEKPFYSLQSRDARGFSLYDLNEVDYFYDAGEIVGEYEKHAKSMDAFVGWSRGLQRDWASRFMVGLALDEARFDRLADSPYTNPIPDDRRLLYPYVGYELVQDSFETTENMNQINQTEDVFLGSRLSARLGFASGDFGSDRDALILDVSAEKGFGSASTQALLLRSGVKGRFDKGGDSPLVFDVSANYYRRQSDHRLLYASLRGSWASQPDMDQYFELGGDSGLRGYPLRYQAGDKLAVFSLEQRYFTDWYPLRLFRLGGAVFFDVGRAWGDSPAGRSNNELLRDVGFGLRIGNARSGLGRMTHIDVAFPLDGDTGINDVQFLVSTRKSF